MVGELDVAGLEAHLGRAGGVVGHHADGCTLFTELQESLVTHTYTHTCI